MGVLLEGASTLSIKIVIILLLADGAKTDMADSNSQTCLHTAAYHEDNADLVGLLLEHGAPLQAETDDGKTALSLAQERGNCKVCREIDAQRTSKIGKNPAGDGPDFLDELEQLTLCSANYLISFLVIL
jgi:Ankyrin repeats (3 copies)